MKKICFGLIIALLIGANSCNHKAQEQATTATAAPAATEKTLNIKMDQLASNIDPKCEMPMTEAGIADTASFEGKLYGFCSPECKADFMKDPQSYLTKK